MAYPLLFEPILQTKPWGGRRLERFGKALPPDDPIGESWELSDLPEGRSVIRNGPLAGSTLAAALEAERAGLLGPADRSPDGGFPLLIKYLDATANLSVQVHPSPAYARDHPEAHLKSEAWVVLDAEPGAVIYAGLRPGVTAARFRDAIGDGTVVDLLRTVPAVPGQCLYLPSGTCHALGAGIVVAEIQTASDTTFRVYDWGREGRALHVDQAMQCIDFAQTSPPEPTAGSPPIDTDAARSARLLRTEHFGLEMITLRKNAVVPIVSNGLPEVWMVLGGAVRISNSSGPSVDVGLGDTVLIPAGSTQPSAAAPASDARILRITLPSALDGLIA